MQKASKAYRQAMKKPLRNRAYIQISIGVINQDAQRTAGVQNPDTALTYFSSPSKPFRNYETEAIYATAEQGFAKVDGSMAFLPREVRDVALNNGIVVSDLVGGIIICFGISDLDIKGLTIDFGECYPTSFLVENDVGARQYDGNTLSKWSTEDVFSHTSFLKITPISMVNGQGRLRIYEFLCGVGNVFTNKDVKSYSFKDYVSPISDGLPSQDMSLTVYNYSLKYNVDNPDSAINFMELGQEIHVAFGYDVTGKGDVEWLDSNVVYLKSWDADDTQAKFTATDRFDNSDSTYYRGKYRKEGISAYALAEDIFEDMGLEENQYRIDPYLKDLLIYNPVPVVSHTEALQLLANACRCVLIQDRNQRIQLKSSFVPDMTAAAENQTSFSHVENVLEEGERPAYAVASAGFAKVDGSMYFLPRNADLYLPATGYLSNSVADGNGAFEEEPVITIDLEAAYTCFGISLTFLSEAPEAFVLRTYHNGSLISTYEETENSDLTCRIDHAFEGFDQMTITFTKGSPNARIALEGIKFGDITDYLLEYDMDLTATPKGEKQDKVKSLTVVRTIFSESTEEAGQIFSEEMMISPTDHSKTIYFNQGSYDLDPLFAVEKSETETEYVRVLPNGVTVTIQEASDFYAVLNFGNVTEAQTVHVVVIGKEYKTNKSRYGVRHNTTGKEIEWENELISTEQQAAELEEWLAAYYQEPMEYQLSYRGDPRIDAHDLFYLELRDRKTALVRCYQNELKYNGAWSGTMKTRKGGEWYELGDTQDGLDIRGSL